MKKCFKFPAVFLSPFSYFAIVIIVRFAVVALCEFHDDSIIAREHAIHALTHGSINCIPCNSFTNGPEECGVKLLANDGKQAPFTPTSFGKSDTS